MRLAGWRPSPVGAGHPARQSLAVAGARAGLMPARMFMALAMEGQAHNKITIGLVEVMKSFIEVQAETDGTFGGYSAENEAAVSAGDVLATLK